MTSHSPSSSPTRPRRARGVAVAAFAALVALASIAFVPAPARAMDQVKWVQLRELALEYGTYRGRFTTCGVEEPESFKVAVMKYARSQGASDKHLEILERVFDEGEARVRGLKKGFTPEECKEKVESAKAKEITSNVEKWSKLP